MFTLCRQGALYGGRKASKGVISRINFPRFNQCAWKSTLSYEMVGNSEAEHYVVIMHGILGSKANWRTFSRRLHRTYPKYGVLLIDHRAHGASPSFAQPHTVEECAKDVNQLLQSLGINPDVVCGHSFGGKVALGLMHHRMTQEEQIPLHTWVLDAMPGTSEYNVNRPGESSVEYVLPRLRKVSLPILDKENMIAFLEKEGVSKDQALWMTTNLKLIPNSNTYTWKFDLNAVNELYESFLKTDFWPLLRMISSKEGINDSTVHVVRASRNKLWTDEVLTRFKELDGGNGSVKLHLLPESDHWVHIDNPRGLLSLLGGTLKE